MKKKLFIIGGILVSLLYISDVKAGVCDQTTVVSSEAKSEEYTFWSVSYQKLDNGKIFNSDSGLSSNNGYEIKIKRPDPSKVGLSKITAVVIDKVEEFSMSPQNSAIDYKKAFASLDVEKNGIITCGVNEVGKPFEKCKGNDWCNYFCKKMSDDPDMKLASVENQGDTVFYRYNAKWNDCDAGKATVVDTDDCKVYKILTGKDADYTIANDENQARTSIQARAYSLFTATVKAQSTVVNLVDDDDNLSDKINITITGPAPNKDYTVPYTFVSGTYGITGSLHNIELFTVTKNNGQITMQQSDVVGAMSEGHVSSTVSTPVKITYHYVGEKSEEVKQCWSEDKTSKPKNGTCSPASIEKSDSKSCVCKEGGKNVEKFHYTPITSKYTTSKENNYCYKTCKKNTFKLVGPTTNYAEKLAGRNFDWPISVIYDIDCSVMIDVDKYNADGGDLNSRAKKQMTECMDLKNFDEYNSKATVYIKNYKYGATTYNTVYLDSPGTSEIKVTYYDKDGNEIAVKNPNKISGGIIKEINFTRNGNYEYSTEKFKCIQKGSGIAVSAKGKCQGILTTNPYPIHYTETNGSTRDIETVLKIGKTTASHTCSIKIKNELFGFECIDKYCGSRSKEEGIDLLFRPISLAQPFPGKDGKTRTAGENWRGSPEKNSDNLIENYITSKQDIYSKEPIYTINLSSSTIKAIRDYNKDNAYNDFSMKCDEDGKNCINNKFLTNEEIFNSNNYGGKCAGVSKANFEKCRDTE